MWISNAFADIAVVWAKDETGRIHGLIVERGMEGFSTRKLITSGHLELLRQGIDFDNVKVPKENFAKQIGFRSTTRLLRFCSLRYCLVP
jgi:glutaryl-CoA dehydrogenase